MLEVDCKMLEIDMNIIERTNCFLYGADLLIIRRLNEISGFNERNGSFQNRRTVKRAGRPGIEVRQSQ